MTKLQIKYTNPELLKPAEYNPRSSTEQQETKLDESLQQFEIVDPLIVNSAPNRKNIIIGGHFRWREAKKLGFKEVPVVYLNIPDIEKEKELNLRLNANVGQWDLDKLFKEFDMEMVFDAGPAEDFTQYLNGILDVNDDDFDVEKKLEEIKAKAPRTKTGDLIYLGESGIHRIICGDNQDPQVVARLVGTDRINMLHFDPIYNINLNYNKGVSNKGSYGSQKVNDKKPDAEYRVFLKTAFQNGLAHAQPDCHVFSFCDQSYIWLLQELNTELGLDNKRVCLWIKNNANMTPQVAFNKCYEPCVYSTKGNPYLSPIHNFNEVLNKEVGTGNRLTDDIMDLFDIWLAKRVTGQDYEHPTQKPPTLYEKSFRRCTKPGDIILDLFGGSGSQLIAAEQLKRRAFLCEIDPVFCDLIVARYEQLTGKEAIYVSAEE